MSIATVIVTGANRGLGLEIVRQIVQTPPIKPLQVIACARNPPQTSPIQDNSSAQVQVHWHALDVSSKDSIDILARTVQEQYGGVVDVLISNAGINLDITEPHNIDNASKTIAINYDGTTAMMNSFLPLMRRPALPELGRSRIVNVSSVGSKLSSIPSSDLRHAIRHAQSLDEIKSVRDAYLSSVSSGTESRSGWPKGKSYCVSKALLNASTQVLAEENHDFLVNACCPGWCKTDMGSLVGTPAKETKDGAKIPLKLAFGKIEESGKYWENPSVYDTADGQVAEWNI